jgi:hypothetical protein
MNSYTLEGCLRDARLALDLVEVLRVDDGPQSRDKREAQCRLRDLISNLDDSLQHLRTKKAF